MRILTVRQPFAWAIIHMGKDVENRSTNIAGDYRGLVAIHAGLKTDDIDVDDPIYGLIFPPCPFQGDDHNRYACRWCAEIEPQRWAHLGAIIGVVDLVDVHITYEGFACPGLRGPCSEWAMPGGSVPPYNDIFHYELANQRPLTEPLTRWADGTPIKGVLGLRILTAEQEQWILDHMEVTS